MTRSPNRRWFRFSLSGLLLITTMAAILIWTAVEAIDAKRTKAESERLKQENAWLQTQIRTQEGLQRSMRDISEGKWREPPAKGTVPDHWLEAPE